MGGALSAYLGTRRLPLPADSGRKPALVEVT
jgi:hypothetical protein